MARPGRRGRAQPESACFGGRSARLRTGSCAVRKEETALFSPEPQWRPATASLPTAPPHPRGLSARAALLTGGPLHLNISSRLFNAPEMKFTGRRLYLCYYKRYRRQCPL